MVNIEKYKKESDLAEIIKKSIKNLDVGDINGLFKRYAITNTIKNIDEFIKMPFETIKEIHDQIVANPNFDYIKFKEEDVCKNLIDAYKRIVKCELLEKMNVTVCPYCNTAYIFSRDTKTTAQFDHFYPKTQYPLFALCLYNLVPSCYACNHIKGAQELKLSPYDEQCHICNTKFKYDICKCDYIENVESIKILSEFGEINNDNQLKLAILYNHFNMEAKEILRKAQMFDRSTMIEAQKEISHYSSISLNEITSLMYGIPASVNDDDCLHTVLLKFKSDILKQVLRK